MKGTKLNVLIIDDDEDDFILIREMLKDIQGQEYHVTWAPTFNGAREIVMLDTWDVILVDYDLGACTGLDLIREAVEKEVKAPLIMITGRGRYELDVEVMNSGAADYLTKNMINPAFLERAIRYSIERSRSKEILEQLVQERTVDLQNTLEELRVAEEELRTQHEELRVAEEELRMQHEELLQSTLHQGDESLLHRQTIGDLPLAELITDHHGCIVEANQAASIALHTDFTSLTGKLLSLYIDLQDRRRFIQELSRLNGTSVASTETYRLMNDGASWCFYVVPLKKGLAHTSEYYWLLHPIQEGTRGS